MAKDNQIEIENRIKEILTEVFKDLVITSKQTMDLLLKEKNPSDLIALYDFYYYTAKWQKTNQAKASIKYVMNGLKWGRDKTTRRKKQLIGLGLIENVKQTDKKTGKVKGWYVKINYIWREGSILDKMNIHPTENKDSGKVQTTGLPEGGLHHPVDSSTTNALSVSSLNALSVGNKPITYGNRGKPKEYGNPLINQFLIYLKSKAKIIDTPANKQRPYSWTLIQKMKSLAKESKKREPTDAEVWNGVKFLVDCALSDKFHSTKMGDIRYLYNNIGAIIKSKVNNRITIL